NRFDYLHVVTRAKYEGGVFTLKFNGDLKDHLIGMSKNYTLLDMPTMMKFNSVYSFRIYEIIKSKEYTLTYKKENPCDSYELEFNLSEFKFQIGVADVSEKKVQDILAGSHTPNWDKAIEVCENQAYKDWRNFKRFVLDVAQKEINSSTDLILEYEFARGGKGGKIVGIKLLVTPKENAATEVSDVMDKEPKAKVVKKKKKKVSELQKLEMIENVIEFIEEKITMKDARALLEACDYEIEKLEEKYRIAKKQGKIENLVGWLIKACVDEYSEPVSVKEKKGQNTFNNFTQNSYDFTELEKKLLDN
ncbi:MAG: replication initiation protein, partial [Lachnospiraceae bacterium]|nr:replication initiation protein [Lachnospiraceae bacterium]